jgi:hypothetical protein
MSQSVVGHVQEDCRQIAPTFNFPGRVAIRRHHLQAGGVEIEVHFCAVHGLGASDDTYLNGKDLTLEHARRGRVEFYHHALVDGGTLEPSILWDQITVGGEGQLCRGAEPSAGLGCGTPG